MAFEQTKTQPSAQPVPFLWLLLVNGDRFHIRAHNPVKYNCELLYIPAYILHYKLVLNLNLKIECTCLYCTTQQQYLTSRRYEVVATRREFVFELRDHFRTVEGRQDTHQTTPRSVHQRADNIKTHTQIYMRVYYYYPALQVNKD